MNQKVLILVAGLLAGAAVVYFIPKGTTPSAEPVASAPEPTTSASEARPATQPTLVQKEEAPVRPQVQKVAPAPPSAWSKLAEKYGAEKTALSSKITSNITSVINTGLELANTMARGSGASNITQAATRDIMKRATEQLGLSEEQQKQAATVVQTAVDKRMTAVTDLASAMGSEPEQIMGMLLAGDAFARNEITQEEYDRLTLPTRTMLKNMTGLVGGRPGGGGVAQILGDAETTSQINAILNPEQQTKLAEFTAKMAENIQARAAAQNQNGLPFQPGEIPVMELDRLDQSVAAVQQMTAAAKQMMEAMKGLKDANKPK